MPYATKLLERGFTDIIPVIPPDAPLAPTSRVNANDRGKVPGKKRPDETWVGFGGWQKHQTTPADAAQWDRDGANIGLRTERFPAIDIDCVDEALSKRIADPGSTRAFSQSLANRGFQKWREPKSRRMGFRGVALRPTEDPVSVLIKEFAVPTPPEVGGK